MFKKRNKIENPQLTVVEHSQPALTLSNKIKLSLYKKSSQSGIPISILEEVYRRGHSIWNPRFKGTRQQFAYDRVNSFIAGGFAADLDRDLLEETLDVKTPSEKTIAKKFKVSLNTIKKAVKSGIRIEKEHTKSNSKAAEIARDHVNEKPNYYKLLKQYVESTEFQSENKNKPSSRFDGTKQLVDVYKKDTPGQSVLNTIKRICKK